MLYYITHLIYYFNCLSDLRDNFSGIGIDFNKIGIVILPRRCDLHIGRYIFIHDTDWLVFMVICCEYTI